MKKIFSLRVKYILVDLRGFDMFRYHKQEPVSRDLALRLVQVFSTRWVTGSLRHRLMLPILAINLADVLEFETADLSSGLMMTMLLLMMTMV